MSSEKKIVIIQGDITQLSVDVIVNAANRRLLGGGGVDGAIHRAAGPLLRQACAWLPELEPGIRCHAGDAKLTAGFSLPATYVVHTVGPIWQGGYFEEEEILESCYRQSIKLADALKASSIAFPIISGGAYGYPIKDALKVALRTMSEGLEASTSLQQVILVCFLQSDFDLAHELHQRLAMD